MNVSDYTSSVLPVYRANSSQSLILFSVMAGVLATFTLGYNYGLGNQIEMLLPVLRILDPNYCLGDFTVNAFSEYGPRFYYAWICAILACVFSLPAAMLVLTLAQNIGIALVTAFVARDMHGRGTMAPLVAVALVLSLESIWLGGRAGFLHQSYGWPSVFSLMLALPALWQGIRLRPFLAAMLAMFATLIHPLVGVETGGVALGICGLSTLLDTSLPAVRRRRLVLHTLIGICGLGLFTVLVWGPAQTHGQYSTQQFWEIYVRFRVPHHLIPSYFPVRDFVAFLSFMVASGLSWQWWRHTFGVDPLLSRGILIGFGLVLALLFGGWFFVEVIPSQLWAMLQTFRLVFILKWFGLMLCAGTISRAWVSEKGGVRLLGCLLFLPVGPAQPHAMLWAHMIELVHRRLPSRVIRWGMPLLITIGFSGLVWILLWYPFPQFSVEVVTLTGILPLMVLFQFCQRRWIRYGASLLWMVGVIGSLVLNRHHPVPVIGGLIRNSTPVFTLADAHNPADHVALFCRERLSPEVLVLTPPNMGRFRLVSERSIVADFKVFPHHVGMVEWHRRMVDCYGVAKDSSFGAVPEMDRQYRKMNDQHLATLAQAYDITHVVLYPETITSLAVLYEDKWFKLIQMPESIIHK